MPILKASGTTASIVGSEVDLYFPSGNDWYCGYIDTTNMAAGDVLEIRVYATVNSFALSFIRYSLDILTDVQPVPLYYIHPLPSDLDWDISIKQTAGTARNYDWRFF